MAALQWWVRVPLFLGTISPLVALQGILVIQQHVIAGWAMVAAGLVLLLFPLSLFPLARSNVQLTRFSIVESKAVTPDLGAFLLAYLLPLLALSITRGSDIALLIVLLVLIGIMYTRGNLIHVQPIYWIVGWHVYECKKSSGEGCWLITKRVLTPMNIDLRDLGGHVLVDI